MINVFDIFCEWFLVFIWLDYNWVILQLVVKIGVVVIDIKKMMIWGNYLVIQYFDLFYVEVVGKNVVEVVNDQVWIEDEFILMVVKCGVVIIDVCGVLLVVLVVLVIIDVVWDWLLGMLVDDWVLMVVVFDGFYGVLEGLIFLFLVIIKGGNWMIVSGLEIDEFFCGWIDKLIVELVDECSVVIEIGLI